MRFGFCAVLLAGLAGCQPSYSPNSYDSKAVQQANKVDQGMVVGVRKIGISANGTTGAVTGAAAGGIAGSQAASGPLSAFTALGGTLLGGLVGTSVEHAQGDTEGYEYIVRKSNGDLLSVTQKDTTPLAIGQKVLVISGTQARVVPDYTVDPAKDKAEAPKAGSPGADAPKVGPADAPKPSDAPKPADSAPKASDEPTKGPIDLKPAPVAAPDPAKAGTSI